MAKKKVEEKINLDSILFKCRDILRQARNSGSFFEKRDMMLTLVFLRFIGEKFEDGIQKLRQELIAQGLDPDDEEIFAAFFDDATFAADGKLNHTLDGEAKVKNYTLNGNNLVFNLYEGSDTYKVNATSFPDEDGDRLFIIIPKQAAWLGGMVDLVEKENEGLTLTEAQIAELEKEFMETFETFTVILSLSKK